MTRRRAGAALPRHAAAGGATGGDPGPPERYQHGDVVRTEPGRAAGTFYRRVTTQSALDRYLARDQISQRQFDAGMKLYRLWRASGAAQRVIASYSPRVQARRELSDEQAALRRRVTGILRRMGPLSGILVHVCLCDEAARDWAAARGDAPQAGVVVLRLALDALADYWKL
ncbi:MAG: DUF6456 domain-containing protein [Kiloniellaceae bacterium]